MIFAAYPRVVVKLGDERYEFDRASLMFPEVVEIETVSGLSYGEWVTGLSRYSIRSVAALVHVLRRRAGVASNFAAINFAVDDLDVVPLHEDGTEFTAAEVSDDIAKRLAPEDPTSATAAPVDSGGDGPEPVTTAPTSPSSQSDSISGHGSSNGSPGETSPYASPISTQS
jgi:hypothetical protein